MVPAIRRRLMSGKTYGPTYAVTSRSSGSASPFGASPTGTPSRAWSFTPRTLPGPHRFQLVVAGAPALGKHAGLAHRRHEVRVTGPAREYVNVEVSGDPGTCGAPEIGADVHAFRLIRGADGAQCSDLRSSDGDVVVVVEVVERRRVTRRRDHQMSGTVRIQIHHRDRVGRAFENECFGVVGRVDEIAHDTTVAQRGRAGYVRRTPVGPQALEAH